MGEKTGIPPCMLVAMTRRRALKRAAMAAGAVGLSACFDLPGEFGSIDTPGAEFTLPPQTFSLDDEGLEALATVGNIAYLKVEAQAVDDDGELVEVDADGEQVAAGTGTPLIITRELAIVRSGEEELLAFDHYCPHSNLAIAPVEETPEMFRGSWLAEERAIRCGWHKSTFDENGTYLDDLSPETQGIADIAVFDVTFDTAANTGTITF